MSKRILIVEDDVQLSKVLFRQLEAGGYKAFNAYDGDEGLKLAKEKKPDLMIIDIGLPIIDGKQLCEIININPATKDIKTIILTGDRMIGAIEDSYSAGANVYMNKPYNLTHLLAQIKELIG